MAAQQAQLRRDRLAEKHAVIASTVAPTATADEASMACVWQAVVPSLPGHLARQRCAWQWDGWGCACKHDSRIWPTCSSSQACAELQYQIEEVQAAIDAAEADLAIVKAALRETLAVNARKDAELRCASIFRSS